MDAATLTHNFREAIIGGAAYHPVPLQYGQAMHQIGATIPPDCADYIAWVQKISLHPAHPPVPVDILAEVEAALAAE